MVEEKSSHFLLLVQVDLPVQIEKTRSKKHPKRVFRGHVMSKSHKKAEIRWKRSDLGHHPACHKAKTKALGFIISVNSERTVAIQAAKIYSQHHKHQSLKEITFRKIFEDEL